MTEHLRSLKAMVSVMNPKAVKSQIFKGVRMPYKRRKEEKPRKEYDLAEARLRDDIVKELKKHGFIVKRVETMAKGFPDLWVFHSMGKWAGWIELKSAIGVMSKEQKEFKELCEINKVNHMVVRCVDDVMIIVDN